MKLYALVWSPTGGTENVAKAMLSAWSGETEWIDLFRNPDAASHVTFTKEDVCLAMIPSFGGRVPELAVEALSRAAGCGARAVPVVVYGNRAIDDTLTELFDVLQQAGFCCIAAADAVAEHSIFRQYAAGRPDAEDVAELKGYMQKLENLLLEGAAEPLKELPGNRPYKARGNSSFKPFAAEGCIGCGVCVEECPVGAIPMDAPDTVNAERCISCMHCIAVCPALVRVNPEPQLSTAAEKMRDRFAGRKENHLYLG